MWRLIGITPSQSTPSEQERIIEFLANGIDFFHIRKPSLSVQELRDYLNVFPLEVRERLTLHANQSVALEMDLGGVHYNSKNPYPNSCPTGLRKSYSCHSLAEVENLRDTFDYVFLSPIYDSISKQGYKSHFSLEDLKTSKAINDKVIALGGVSKDKFKELKDYGFGGAALLGALWHKTNN
jgi:Thiamine monophosphate synthase